MVDRDVVESLAKELRGTLEYLKIKLRYSEEEYLADVDIQAAVERKLEVAIQLSIDLGSHIISQQNFPYPDTYRAVFFVLGSQGVIPLALAEKLEKMAGFRNILVHDYIKLDSRKVYQALHDGLPDIEAYLKAVVRYME